MKILNKLSAVLCMIGLLALGSVSVTSCDDELSTNQYKGGISLNVFGPSPVLRGGEIRFLGSGMNQVTAVVFPGGTEVTEITVVSDTEIRVTVPQTAEEGYITLKTPAGDIVTKTKLTYLEPITIESFSPASVRPGDELTITGDYLNLMHAVIFEGTEEDVTVLEEEFIEHTRQTIRVKVPDMAITGRIALSDAAEEGIPNVMYAEGELTVIVPSKETIEIQGETKTEYKVNDQVEIIGQDLNQVEAIRMSNGEFVNDFKCEETTAPGTGAETAQAKSKSRADEASSGKWYKITFTVPDNASSGPVVMITASGVEIEFMELKMTMPELTDTTPITDCKPGSELTLTGTNLDLVANVGFTGVEESIEPNENSSATELKVTMPAQARSGKMYLITAGRDSVAVDIETLKPALTSFASSPVEAGKDVTLNGSDLDLVGAVIFGGERVAVTFSAADALTVTVPVGLAAGQVEVVLEMINGETVTCETKLEVTAPQACMIVDGEALSAAPGANLTVTVQNAELLTDVQIGGENVRYILNGDQLMIAIPENASGSVNLNLVSGDVTMTYTLTISGGASEIVLYSGPAVATGNWAGYVQLTAQQVSEAQVGSVVTVYISNVEEGAQGVFQNGSWQNIDPDTNEISLQLADTSFSMTVSDAILTQMQSGGLIVKGQKYTIESITLKR